MLRKLTESYPKDPRNIAKAILDPAISLRFCLRWFRKSAFSESGNFLHHLRPILPRIAAAILDKGLTRKTKIGGRAFLGADVDICFFVI